MKKLGNAKVATGKYTDKEGKEKNSYATIGSAFQRGDGSIALKVDTMPIGQWDGWINIWADKDDEDIPF